MFIEKGCGMAREFGGLINVKAPAYPGEDETKIRRGYSVVFGKAIKDAEIRYNTSRRSGEERRRVRVYIRYNTKSYIRVEAFGDSDAAETLATIEEGDVLLVAGHRKDELRKTKKGMKKYYGIRASTVVPMGLMRFTAGLLGAQEKIPMGISRFLLALWRDPEIRKRAEKWDAENEKPDVWESGF